MILTIVDDKEVGELWRQYLGVDVGEAFADKAVENVIALIRKLVAERTLHRHAELWWKFLAGDDPTMKPPTFIDTTIALKEFGIPQEEWPWKI